MTRQPERQPMQLDLLYRHRFSESELKAKEGVWRVLCTHFFSRYVPPEATVLDVGAGQCEFINHICAKHRIAVDANPDVERFAESNVKVFCRSAENMDFLADGSVDVVFSSNFFEHFPNKPALSGFIKEIHRVLKVDGKLLVMGPNIRYLPGEYWDYYDHHVPLTEKSVEELLHLSGYQVEASLPRFMPYTVKSRLPKWPWLVRIYLALGRFSFPVFGKQFFVVARRLPS